MASWSEAHGRLDSTTSKAFGDRLTSLLETGHGALVVDLKSIAYISSLGFQALKNGCQHSTTLAHCSNFGCCFYAGHHMGDSPLGEFWGYGIDGRAGRSGFVDER